MEKKRDSITILSEHYQKILKKVQDPVNGFSSPEEYIDYVLNEILSENEDIQDQDKAKIQDELRKLGYI
tara:strand:- start:54 stop:260 length:207 start_codon:yes stop_codon:yes gene_type:complete